MESMTPKAVHIVIVAISLVVALTTMTKLTTIINDSRNVILDVCFALILLELYQVPGTDRWMESNTKMINFLQHEAAAATQQQN